MQKALLPNTDVTSLTLRGPVVGGRDGLAAMVTAALTPDELVSDLVTWDALIGKMEAQLAALRLSRRAAREERMKRDLQLRSHVLLDDRTYLYADCFVTEVRFPRLAAEAAADPYEQVSLKPAKLEVTGQKTKNG